MTKSQIRFGDIYKTYRYKIIIYPLICSFSLGFLWFYTSRYLSSMLVLFGLGFLFGIVFASMGKIFGLRRSIVQGLLLSGLLIVCYVLALWTGLFFGLYFEVILGGNVIFAVLLFLLDHIFSQEKLRFSSIILYVIGAFVSTLIAYVLILLYWEMNIDMSFLGYPLVFYIYIQISLLCRLSVE